MAWSRRCFRYRSASHLVTAALVAVALAVYDARSWLSPAPSRRVCLTSAVLQTSLLAVAVPALAEDLVEDLKTSDIFFPASLEGEWKVSRKVISTEGDMSKAEAAWRGLGGCGKFADITKMSKTMKLSVTAERFDTRFVNTPASVLSRGIVADRGFELQSRLGTSGKVLEWDIEKPNQIRYSRDDGSEVNVRVWRRNAEQYLETFDYEEIYTITHGGSELLVRMTRRYEPKKDYNGNSGVQYDIVETMETFELKDGQYRMQLRNNMNGDRDRTNTGPLSTMKTQVRLNRA